MSSYWRNKSEIVQAVSTEKAMTKLTSPTSKKSTSHNVVILVRTLCLFCVFYLNITFSYFLLIVVATADLKTGTY